MAEVYLIRDTVTDEYKIGVTRTTAMKRLKALQTGNAHELELVSSFETTQPFDLEKLLHRHYFSKRLHGEWFALTENDADDFKGTCNILLERLQLIQTIHEQDMILTYSHD